MEALEVPNFWKSKNPLNNIDKGDDQLHAETLISQFWSILINLHCQKFYNTHFPLLHYSPSIDIQLNQIVVKYPHSMMEQKLSMFLAIYKENSLFNSKVELIYLFIKCSFFIMVWSKLIKHIQVSKCLLFNSLFFLRSRISLGVAHQNMDPRVCGSPPGSSSFLFYWLLTMIIQ